MSQYNVLNFYLPRLLDSVLELKRGMWFIMKGMRTGVELRTIPE